MDLDTDDLEAYLAREHGIDVGGTAVLGDGINLVVAISTGAGGLDYVLRRPNKLRQTALFNTLEREYELLQRLASTPIPTPEPVLYCDDPSVVGGPFLVTTSLEGETVPLGADLPERFRRPGPRRRLAHLVVDTLADVHSLAVDPFEEVCEYQTPSDQVDHASNRLDEVARATGREFARLRSVADRLERNAPEPSRTTLVHGDFRPGNLLFAGEDRPAVTGVIDWETAMLGDPSTELGYLLLRWRDDGDPTPSLDSLEARYGDREAIERLRRASDRGLAPFSSAPGSPSRRELVASYEDTTGTSYDHDRFYRSHAAFMLATVWADLHRHRVLAGEPSDFEPRVDYLATVAERVLDGEFAL